MHLTFTGGRELVRALRALPQEVRKRVLAASVMAGGGIIQAAAAQKAPRDVEPRRRRGKRLADSLRTILTEDSHAGVTVNVTTRDPVAHLLEYGHQIIPRGKTRARASITTVRISKRTGKQVVSTRLGVDPTARARLHDRRRVGATGFVAPRPFLRPAFDENKAAVLRKIAEVLGSGIAAEAQRLAGADHSAGRVVSGPAIRGAA